MNISSKKRFCSTADLFSFARVVLLNIYKAYKRFYISQGGFEVLKLQYFKLMSVTIVTGVFRTYSNLLM